MKKKYILSCLIFLLVFHAGKTQTVLTAGDIAITGFVADDPDKFSFVVLRDVQATTSINFTDRAWQTTGFRGFEGTITWTADTDLICGTEIIITDDSPFSSSIGSVTDSGALELAALDGDQILAYQGPDATPTFLYAINFSNFGWVDNDDANSSALPLGLTNGVNAIDAGDFENGTYNCYLTNDPASILTNVSSIINWTLSDTVIPIGGCYYTCCIATTIWDGLNWDNGFPDNSMTAIIAGDYYTASSLPLSFEACSLIVTAGNELNINEDDFVLVVNDIEIDGLIEMASEGSLVQVNDWGTVTLYGAGLGRLSKITTPIDAIYEYTFWSSAFSNETVGAALIGVPVNRIFRYDAANYEDSDADSFDDNSDDWILAGQAEVMIPGKGYAAFARPESMGYPEQQQFIFQGEFNTGVITTPVTISPDLANPQNWNLLGNPYPSAINADAFINDPANVGVIGGTIYLWTHISPPEAFNPGPDVLNFSEDDYASYTAGVGGVSAVSGGPPPIGNIASGQGFFIEGLTNGVATFNNAMREKTGNDNFFRATDRIWLNLENDLGAFSQILIGFVEGATDGVDRLYDGRRLDGGSLISLSSLIDDKSYAIQGREPLTEEEIVPLSIKNLVEGENEYKISIENVEGLLETSEIYLVDNFMNITHDLNSGEYRFNSELGVHKDRFELFLKNNLTPDILIEEELLIIKNEDDSLSFTTTNNSAIQNVQVFDVLGRQLFDEDFNEEGSPNSIEFNQLQQTIFIVKATLANGKVLTKKGLK